MANSQGLAVQEKKEVSPKEEKTVPARYYIPSTDIYETEDALTIVMEIPGVEKKNVNINLENDVLHVEALIDFAKYEGLEPVYSEYNVGHYARRFSLSNKIDREGIAADMHEGTLRLTLKKAKESLARRITIN